MEPPACSALDSYESLEVIGTGSFGTIRKVRRKTDGQILARKELNFGRMTERDRKQIVCEVNILKDMNHEHIVRYHDRFVDRDNGILYIIMEYCGGGDLAAVIQRCRREGTLLSEDTIWSYFLQIVLALHQCHHPGVRVHTGALPPVPDTQAPQDKRGQVVLHRDLKPENIFLNGDHVVKLGDFGLSKQLAGSNFANTYVGTPYYMSPEVMQEKAYDQKSDIWSLGCLLYELCALSPPFHDAKTHSELAQLIQNARVPPLPRGYSASLTQVVKAMLNVDPKLRPSAQQLLQHERLDLAHKIMSMEKTVKQMKIMKTNLLAREAELDARTRELEQRDAEREAAFRSFLAQKESEIKDIMDKREQELREAMLQREREMCQAVLEREEDLKTKWDQREEEIRVAWEARDAELSGELRAREEALQKEQEHVIELQAMLDAQLGSSEDLEKKSPLDEVKSTDALSRLRTGTGPPKTPVSRFAAKSSAALAPSPGSAMKGVVLTSTGEALPTPPPHHAVPGAPDLAKLLQASPVVGLDFAKFAERDCHHDEEDDGRAPSPCPNERPVLTTRSRKLSAVNLAAGRSALPVPVLPPSAAPKPTTSKSDKENAGKRITLGPAPVYDLADEENLPSPFIKRSAQPAVPTTGVPVASRAAPARPTLTKRLSNATAAATAGTSKPRPSLIRAKLAGEDARKAMRTGTV